MSNDMLDILVGGIAGAAGEIGRQSRKEVSWLRELSLAQLRAKSGAYDSKGTLRAGDSKALAEVRYAEQEGMLPPGSYERLSSSPEGINEASILVAGPQLRAWLDARMNKLTAEYRVGEGSSRAEAVDEATIKNWLNKGTLSEQRERAQSVAASMKASGKLPEDFNVQNLVDKDSVENFLNRPDVIGYSSGLEKTIETATEGEFNRPSLLGRQAADQESARLTRRDQLGVPEQEGRQEARGESVLQQELLDSGVPGLLGTQAAQQERARLGTRSQLGTDAIAGELSAVERSAEQRVADELDLSRREGLSSGESIMAERSVTGEDPRGAVITMRNPRNPSEEIQVREGSIDATLLADSGWIPSTEVESFTNEQGRLMRQIGPTVQVQKDGRWIDADTFYGRSSSDTPDMLSVSGGNRRPPPNDPIVSLSRGVDFEESLDTVLSDPQKIRESTPSNLKALGYEYVDPSLVPNFDPIEAGVGLWDAGGKVLLNRTPVVGQSLQALSAGSFAEANEKSKLMHARVINIVRKLSSVAEVRPGIWDQMLALREAAQSGIFQTEERAVQQFEAMAVEARRMIGFMNDIIEDPTSHVNDIREAKSALRSSEQILALTQNMLFAHELYSTSIPIGNKNLKIGNLDRNDLDNLLSYMGSAYDQTGSLPEGITPRKLALLSFYEKNIVGQGDR